MSKQSKTSCMRRACGLPWPSFLTKESGLINLNNPELPEARIDDFDIIARLNAAANSSGIVKAVSRKMTERLISGGSAYLAFVNSTAAGHYRIDRVWFENFPIISSIYIASAGRLTFINSNVYYFSGTA